MPSLPERFRTETRALHSEAERTEFMRLLLAGRMDAGSYRSLLINLQAIYAALEPTLVRHAAHPSVAPVVFPALFRSAALVADLHTLRGEATPVPVALAPSAAKYVARIQALSDSRPELLVAHVYVRYLGDLNGGQLLRRIIEKSASLAASTGVSFYDFGDADQTKSLTARLREGLGKVDVDPATAEALVEEARLSFRLHVSLFDELRVLAL